MSWACIWWKHTPGKGEQHVQRPWGGSLLCMWAPGRGLVWLELRQRERCGWKAQKGNWADLATSQASVWTFPPRELAAFETSEQKRQVAGLLWGNWVGDEDRSREADDRITLRDAGYQAGRDGCILGRGQHDAGRTRLPATGRIWIRGIQTPGKTWPAPGKEWKC